MTTDTDIRLRSHLDANQRDREQMCRAIVALDRRYTEVRPRHPLGGPDGGRDIECRFQGDQIVFGAVGFQNGANDSEEQKKKIRQKFAADLESALAANPDLKGFVFLTNIHLTQGEQSEMKSDARSAGIGHCDILDRERLRIELDSPAGFFIRFQHLGIALSEAEQASFLAHYGDQIQQVVTTGFQKVEQSLNRLLFLQESQGQLGSIHFSFKLREAYPASAIGHFRAFVTLFLHDIQGGILSIWFGTTDKSNRFRADLSDDHRNEPPGIGSGVASGAWEQRVKLPKGEDDEQDNEDNDDDGSENSAEKWMSIVQVNSSSSVGRDPVSAVGASYRNNDQGFLRYRSGLSLKDLDECMYLPVVNLSLAEKIESIEVFAGGYRVAHIGQADFKIDRSHFDPEHKGAQFSAEELSDPWVRLRPTIMSSAFHLRFDEQTPTRFYSAIEITGPDGSA